MYILYITHTVNNLYLLYFKFISLTINIHLGKQEWIIPTEYELSMYTSINLVCVYLKLNYNIYT